MAVNRGASSRNDRWPAPGKGSKRAPGIRRASSTPFAYGTTRSASPCATSVGAAISSTGAAATDRDRADRDVPVGRAAGDERREQRLVLEPHQPQASCLASARASSISSPFASTTVRPRTAPTCRPETGIETPTTSVLGSSSAARRRSPAARARPLPARLRRRLSRRAPEHGHGGPVRGAVVEPLRVVARHAHAAVRSRLRPGRPVTRRTRRRRRSSSPRAARPCTAPTTTVAPCETP